MSLIESPHKEVSPKEKVTEKEREISVEIERKIIKKYSPLLMASGLSEIEAQLKWITNNGKKYRDFFNSHKNEIIQMNSEDPDKTIDYIEKQLEVDTA